MARIKAINQKKFKEAGSGDDSWIASGQINTTLKVVTDHIDFALTPVQAGDFIEVVTPPVGARIQGMTIASADYVNPEVLALVGDSLNNHRYMDAELGGEQFQTFMLSAGHQYIIGTNEGDEQILIEIGNAHATEGKMTITIFYTI